MDIEKLFSILDKRDKEKLYDLIIREYSKDIDSLEKAQEYNRNVLNKFSTEIPLPIINAFILMWGDFPLDIKDILECDIKLLLRHRGVGLKGIMEFEHIKKEYIEKMK
jgi:predicted HTH domain antitoxin